MEIKLLEQIDIDLMKEVLEEDNMIFNVDYLTNFINTPNTYGFIAKENNNIVGFAYAYSLVRPDGKTMFYLHSVGILQNYRDKGIGTTLLEYIVSYAKENNYSEVFVITDKENTRACHVYEKTGAKNDVDNEIVYVYDFK